MACASWHRHRWVANWHWLGGRRIFSMASWLEDFEEKLGRSHCRANQRAPNGNVDFNCMAHFDHPALRGELSMPHGDWASLVKIAQSG